MWSALSRPRTAPLVACLVLAASQAHGGTVETRTPFGTIEMVEEVRTRDPGEPPIMHVATEWTKLHLRWGSTDGVVTVDLIDDGWMIEAVVAAKGASTSCITSVDHLQYSGAAGEYEIADQMRVVLAWLKTCPGVSSKAAAGYARTLADGAADLTRAEDGLRARARALFRRTPVRCLPPILKKDEPPVIPLPFQGPVCRPVAG